MFFLFIFFFNKEKPFILVIFALSGLKPEFQKMLHVGIILQHCKVVLFALSTYQVDKISRGDLVECESI